MKTVYGEKNNEVATIRTKYIILVYIKYVILYYIHLQVVAT